jgi:hypothetical protein
MDDKQLHSLMTAIILAGRLAHGDGADIKFPAELAQKILDFDPNAATAKADPTKHIG